MTLCLTRKTFLVLLLILENFSRIDLNKGIFQVPLTEESKKLTAINTPRGIFQYNYLTLGMTNTPATFNKVMQEVMQGIEGVELFVDDVLIHSPLFEQYIESLGVVLERLPCYNLTIKPSKCLVGYVEIPFLGHVVRVYLSIKQDCQG